MEKVAGIDLSYSKIRAWRFCRQSFKYGSIDRIEPRKKPKQLEMGSAIHECIEAYRKGLDWRKQLNQFKLEFNKLLPDEKEHFGDLPKDVERIVTGYISHYKEEDKGLKWHLVEDSIGPIEIVPGVNFSLKPDALVEDTMGRMFLVEIKTGRNLPGEDFRVWNLQTILYIWGLREMGYKVNGVLWDHVRTKAPTVPRLLKNGTLSKREIDTDYGTYYDAIVANGLNPDDYQDVLDKLKYSKSFYARYRLPVKEPMIEQVLRDAKISAREIKKWEGLVYRDISTMKCPKCMYRSLCEAALMGGDEAMIKKREFVAKQKPKSIEREADGEEEGAPDQ